MKALVLQEKNSLPVFSEVEMPVPAEGQVLVEVKAAALNHRDVWITKGRYPNIATPVILGSDGAGRVGERDVVIQPGTNWGGNPNAQDKNYSILGQPANGTFAGFVVVDKEQVFDKPPHLTFEQAAALTLAGLTAFRVLFTRCRVEAGEKILVTGIGGGVALCCLQFALAAGLEVFVTSSSDEKIEKAVGLGATGGANYTDPDWQKQLQNQAGGFDVVVDSAGGEGFANLVKLCNPGGRIGIYGGTKGGIPDLSPQPIFWKQLSILGSTMGTADDFAAMLEFANRHKIVPVVDSVFDLQDGQLAFKRMEEGKQFGKVVLKLP